MLLIGVTSSMGRAMLCATRVDWIKRFEQGALLNPQSKSFPQQARDTAVIIPHVDSICTTMSISNYRNRSISCSDIKNMLC